MQDPTIFSIGHQRAKWLAANMAAIAGNVANADTPGYQARDIRSFQSVLDEQASPAGTMLRTHPGHLVVGSANQPAALEPVPRSGPETKHSGNGVNLEGEMAKLGEARSEHATLTAILASFHRMLLSSTRG